MQFDIGEKCAYFYGVSWNSVSCVTEKKTGDTRDIYFVLVMWNQSETDHVQRLDFLFAVLNI
jgi:hypothetical protein